MIIHWVQQVAINLLSAKVECWSSDSSISWSSSWDAYAHLGHVESGYK